MASKPRTDAADHVFKTVAAWCALLTVLLILGFFIQLLWHSLPALKKFGAGFVFSNAWNPAKDEFGAAAAIYGTLVTTAIAVLLATPLSFMVAMFLVETAPRRLSLIMEPAIDLLAAIPSIIYGMWGLFVLMPAMEKYVLPFIKNTLGLDVLPFFKGSYNGGFFTAGIVLALMILPFICAVMRDVFKMVPPVMKEAAYGVGATTTEVTVDITLRYGMQGVLGAIFLGLGRAVGETMAVLFVIGNAPLISVDLFSPGSTIASTLANNFSEAEGVFKSSLFLLGLILLLITFLIQIAAQWWLNAVRAKAGRGL